MTFLIQVKIWGQLQLKHLPVVAFWSFYVRIISATRAVWCTGVIYFSSLVWTVRVYCFHTGASFVISIAFTAFLSSMLCCQGHCRSSPSLTCAQTRSAALQQRKVVLHQCSRPCYISSKNLLSNIRSTKQIAAHKVLWRTGGIWAAAFCVKMSVVEV